MPRFANSNRPSPAPFAALPALLLLAASLGACGDDLNAPDVQSCNLQLAVPVTEPATVQYSVAADNAIVASVTFTSAVGDSTITSFSDQSGQMFTFERTVMFPEATAARIAATGEVATSGEIAVGFIVIPAESSQNPISDLRFCQG